MIYHTHIYIYIFFLITTYTYISLGQLFYIISLFTNKQLYIRIIHLLVRHSRLLSFKNTIIIVDKKKSAIISYVEKNKYNAIIV